MDTKKLVGAAAFSAVLAAGGVAGALFGAPVLSGAQEGEETPTSDGVREFGRHMGAGEHRGEHRGEHLETAAEALGMTTDELVTELQSGKSIADVAAERNVDKQKVIDALVAAATARIDEMKSELPDRIADLVERDGLGFRGPGGRGGPGHIAGHMAFNSLDDAATALGISRLELREALESGKSIAQVAEEKGKNIDDVKAAMVADFNARIDEAVSNGRLDADRAAEMKANHAERVDELVTREGLPLRNGHRHGFGPGAADDEGTDTSDA